MGDEVKVVFQPAGRAVRVARGTTVSAAAGQAGIALEQVCGGKGTCGKCKVRLLSGRLGPMSEAERRHLSAEDVAGGIRLACQAALEADSALEAGWASGASEVSILVEGLLEPVALEPLVHKEALRLPPADLEDPAADLEVLRRGLGNPSGLAPTLEALRALPGARGAEGGLVTAVRADGQLLAVEPGDTQQALYGLAVDIGTTTVVAYLLDLASGERLAAASTLNPQTRYGDDVIARVEVAGRPEGLETLRTAIVGTIDDLLGQAASEAGVDRTQVYALAVVGNTAMHHLFLGLSPEALGRSPYAPVVTEPLQFNARDAGLHAHPSAQLFVLPNIAGFVGADTVGVLLATRLLDGDDLRLAIDIGTNGEMVLGSRQRMLACSTAAGPAFEGAQLSHGMRAAHGAIDHVDLEGDRLLLHAIGRGKIRGICGSGVVDAIAALRQLEIIDSTGRLRTADDVPAGPGRALASRLVAGERGRAFVLATAEETAIDVPVVLTQGDIRQIQLAKGAIRAGIEIMLKTLGAAREDVREVCLAGAFGNYIRPESALAIGLIPRFPAATITPVGNAAGAGAQLALLSRQAWQSTAGIVAGVEYLELSLRQDFQRVFMEAMTM